MAWTHVRGHDAVFAAFQQAHRRGRIGQAYLFVGPHGIGKRQTALELARALLCEHLGQDLVACGRCSACILCKAGTHPDLFTVAKPADKVDFPIDTIRELCALLDLKPVRGRRKIAILDDADDLTDASANCFLKTLEEPPIGSILFLIGTSADRQLPTIRSRCRIVRFAPLGPADLRALLTAQGKYDPAALEKLLPRLAGSVTAAEDMADESLWEFRSTLLRALTAPRPDMVDLTAKWMEFYESAGKEGPLQRKRAAFGVRFFLEMIAAAWKLGQGLPVDGLNDDERKALRSLGERIDAAKLEEVLTAGLEADHHVDRKVQLILLLELLLDKTARALIPPKQPLTPGKAS